jgi:hypothetical protein
LENEIEPIDVVFMVVIWCSMIRGDGQCDEARVVAGHSSVVGGTLLIESVETVATQKEKRT